MIEIPLDFSAVEEYPVLKPGVYNAVIEKLRYKEAQEEGKFPQISVEYTVTDEDNEGEKLFANLSFSPKAMFRMLAFFKAFGFDAIPTKLDVEPDSGLVLSPDLAGIPVQVKAVVEKYQGVDRNKVNDPPFVKDQSAVPAVASSGAKDGEKKTTRGKGRTVR